MSDMTNQLETLVLRRIFHQIPLTIPANLSLALLSSAPDDAGAGGTELVGFGYTRTNLGLTAGNWTFTAPSTITNAVAFTSSTASANWSTITHYIMYNGAIPWFAGALVSPVNITTGNSFTAAIGQIEVIFAGNLTNFSRQKVAEYIFRQVSVTWPEALDVSLVSTTPSASVEGTELPGDGYARMYLPCDDTTWVYDSIISRMSNGIPLIWEQATANWPAIVGLNYYTTLTADRWFASIHSPSRVITLGSQARFLAGKLGFTAN